MVSCRNGDYLYEHMSNLPIKVAIVDDDPEIRQLMMILIDGSPGFYCKQAFSGCAGALKEMADDLPEIVLMDIDMPGMSGIECLKALKRDRPAITVLMLTVREDEEAIFESLCAGATGYLVKGLPPVKLLAAIEEAHRGGAPMSSTIAKKVIRSFHVKQEAPLSKREMEVLQMLCDGETYKTIAAQLFISPNTVKMHIKHIYDKLHVNTRAELVGKAYRDRLIR